MARSRSGGRASRPSGGRRSGTASSALRESPAAAVGSPPVPSLASATLPRVWQGVGYRPVPDPTPARRLFDFAAVHCPATESLALCWAASADDALVGAMTGEREAASVFLHGPVVVTDREPMEVAAQLVAAVLDHARALGVETVYARPNGLDRVWVRFGFIPVPESALPPALGGRPGTGLYAWRGGSALWSFRESPRD